MSNGQPLVDATAQLRAALEDTAQALGGADQEGLLRGELALQLALERLSARIQAADGVSREALRLEAHRMRDALLRCRQVGDILLDVVRMSLQAQGRTPEYSRRDMAPPPQPPRVHARG